MQLKNSVHILLARFLTLSVLLLEPSFIDSSYANDDGEKNLTDYWFVMSVGKTPWGYFHERFSEKDDRLFYRYEMTKKENGKIYQESLGAIATKSLVPVAFNLNKKGEEVLESYSGSYQDQGDVGLFTVQLTGMRQKNLKRHVRKGVILEAFFPMWVKKNWDRIKKGFRDNVSIFTEDADSGEYQVKTATLDFLSDEKISNAACKKIKVAFDNRKSEWCIAQDGGLVEMTMKEADLIVRRTTDAQAAKSHLESNQ